MNGGFMTPPPLGVVTAKKLSNGGTSVRWFCDTKVVSSHRLLFQSLQKDVSALGQDNELLELKTKLLSRELNFLKDIFMPQNSSNS